MITDEDGHLWCVVPPHARFSYFGDPEKTAAAWRETDAGPAFTVGDLGHVDEDGYVFLDGRREDLIISGGVNVYPAEVERVLGEVAGVEDIAVFGVEDEQWGQRVCAAVVGPADEATLRAHAREHLAPAKRPKEYHRLDALPRTPTGKVRRLDLPDQVGAALMGFSKAELASFRDVEVPDLLPDGPPAAVRRDQPRAVDGGGADALRPPGNRFYPALLRAGIITEPVAPSDGHDRPRARAPAGPRARHHQPGAPRHGAVPPSSPRPSCARAGSGSASWCGRAGRGSWRSPGSRPTGTRSGSRRHSSGRQDEPFEGAELWVVPNPSGLNAHETVASLAEAYAAPATGRRSALSEPLAGSCRSMSLLPLLAAPERAHSYCHDHFTSSPGRDRRRRDHRRSP